MQNNPEQNPSKSTTPNQEKPANAPSAQPRVEQPNKPVETPPASAPATKP